jgi:hypothetical protein
MSLKHSCAFTSCLTLQVQLHLGLVGSIIMLSSQVPSAEHISEPHSVSLVPGHTSTLLYTSEPCVALAHGIVQDLDLSTGQLRVATRASDEVLRKVTVVALSSGLQPPHTIYSQQVQTEHSPSDTHSSRVLCSRLCCKCQCLQRTLLVVAHMVS